GGEGLPSRRRLRQEINRVLHFGGGFGEQDVRAILDIEALRAEARGDHRNAGGHRFEDFETRAAAGTQGDDDREGGAVPGANVIDRARDNNAGLRGKIPDLLGRVSANDHETEIGMGDAHGRPDVAREFERGFDVGVVIHGADEENVAAFGCGGGGLRFRVVRHVDAIADHFDAGVWNAALENGALARAAYQVDIAVAKELQLHVFDQLCRAAGVQAACQIGLLAVTPHD